MSRTIALNAVLLGLGGGLLSLLVLSWLRAHAMLSSPVGLAFFFVLPGLGAVLCAVALVLALRWKLLLLMTLASAWLTLTAGEIILQASYQRRSPPTSDAAAPDPDVDTRSRLEVVSDLRADGIEAFPTYSAWVVYRVYHTEERPGERHSKFRLDGDEVVPLANPSFVKVVVCNETGSHLVIDTDELGFNNPEGSWEAPRFELAVIGDSYVQGYCVPVERNLVAHLRRAYPSVLNVGLGGTGSLSQLAMLREFVASRKPARVVWAFFENDLQDLEYERSFPHMLRYLDPDFSQQLEARQERVETALRSYLDEMLAEQLAAEAEAAGLAGVWDRIGSVLGLYRVRAMVERIHAKTAVDFGLFETVLRTTRDEVRGWGGELYFVFLPSWVHVHEGAQGIDFLRERNRARVLEIVGGLGVPVIDAVETFSRDAEPERFFLGLDKHYTEAGYEAVAAAIVERLAPGRP